MSEHSTPTVRVVSPVSKGNPHGYVVINQSDVNNSHELFTAENVVPPVADVNLIPPVLTSANLPKEDNTGDDELKDNDDNVPNVVPPVAKNPWEV